ncbi:DUF3592 domain-containing protein [Chryseolinea sp. T2]|uniref:DUF3592 domain-containing protein n=1 Tax=Chryseolinea sp. T2 TaxID=3129255 RepID=UPI003077DFF1
MSFLRWSAFVVLSLPMIYMFYKTIARPYIQIQSSAEWPAVTASITKFSAYKGEVNLEYAFVDGADTIRGNSLFFGARTKFDQDFVKELEELFSGASKVRVFVNPFDPQENVVVRELAGIKSVVIAALFITMVEFFMFMLLIGLDLKHDPKEIVDEIVVLN